LIVESRCASRIPDLQHLIFANQSQTTGRSIQRIDLSGSGVGDRIVIRLLDSIATSRMDNGTLASNDDVHDGNQATPPTGQLTISAVVVVPDATPTTTITTTSNDQTSLKSSIQWLNFASCDLTDQCAAALDRVLRSKHVVLQVLKLAHNRLSDSGIEQMVGGLASTSTLTWFDVHGNCIGARGIRQLGMALQRNGSIRSVRLGSNMIGDSESRGLWNVFARTSLSMLETLDLQNNVIGTAPMERLARVLENAHCRLRNINLSWNPLADQGVAHLAEALVANTSLRRLDLCHVEMSAIGMACLSSALINNDTLEHLNVSDNAIECFDDVALHMARLRRLRELDLTRTWTQSAHAFLHVASALAANPSIECLSLAHNRSDKVTIDALAESLTHNHRVRVLDLSGVRLNSACIDSLCDMLARNRTLTRLSLANNHLASKAMCPIAVALADDANSCLVELVLSRNHCDDKLADLLIKALETNRSLEHLELLPSIDCISPIKLALIQTRLRRGMTSAKRMRQRQRERERDRERAVSCMSYEMYHWN
jgi:Ran GTPase-activating protein (RanGAP) involved in mRNA processing and transport